MTVEEYRAHRETLKPVLGRQVGRVLKGEGPLVELLCELLAPPGAYTEKEWAAWYRAARKDSRKVEEALDSVLQ